jgi:hypothetical protein
VALFFRLKKSGTNLFLIEEQNPKHKTCISCIQRDTTLSCKPLFSEDLICYCEGHPPVKNEGCSKDIGYAYAAGLNTNYSLGKLLRK